MVCAGGRTYRRCEPEVPARSPAISKPDHRPAPQIATQRRITGYGRGRETNAGRNTGSGQRQGAPCVRRRRRRGKVRAEGQPDWLSFDAWSRHEGRRGRRQQAGSCWAPEGRSTSSSHQPRAPGAPSPPSNVVKPPMRRSNPGQTSNGAGQTSNASVKPPMARQGAGACGAPAGPAISYDKKEETVQSATRRDETGPDKAGSACGRR